LWGLLVRVCARWGGQHAEAQDKLEAANAADEPRRDSRANMEALTKNENLDAVKKEIAAMAASVASSK